jgi:hypothetical protein
MFIEYLVQANPEFLDTKDWPLIALVSKACNRIASRGTPRLRSVYQEKIYNCLQQQVVKRTADDNFRKRTFLADKIRERKFYQLASFVSQYENIKNFRFRYFSSSWSNVVQVPITMYQVYHPGVILMSSCLSPGKFWETLGKYIQMKTFYSQPQLTWDLDPLEIKIWYYYYLLRGLPFFDLSVHLGTFYAMKAFARKFREYPALFQNFMAGKWCHVGHILIAYERDGDMCHFPIPCHVYPRCLHSRSESPDLEWDMWTEECYDEKFGYVVDEIHV